LVDAHGLRVSHQAETFRAVAPFLRSRKVPSAKKSQRLTGRADVSSYFSGVRGWLGLWHPPFKVNVRPPVAMPMPGKNVPMTQPMTQGLDATTGSRSDRAARGFEFIDHPGDVKLRAWGRELESLFVAAAEGMMAFLFGNGIAKFVPERTETIEIEAKDREALLVDWLSELLYRATCGYCAYMGFWIHELSESKLKATVATAAAEAVEDIKAVTHHELSLRECERRWEASIVFDV
jgi:SHS2 domain-containing protein